jgi:hypothetical protein
LSPIRFVRSCSSAVSPTLKPWPNQDGIRFGRRRTGGQAPRMLVKSIRFCRSQASYRGVAFLAFGLSSRTIVAPILRGLLLVARFDSLPSVIYVGLGTLVRLSHRRSHPDYARACESAVGITSFAARSATGIINATNGPFPKSWRLSQNGT